eukprot:tig00000057_g108.t1
MQPRVSPDAACAAAEDDLNATVTVLSLDGGGFRGVIELEILREIELMTGRRIGDLFDVCAATSVGSMAAAALFCPPSLPAAGSGLHALPMSAAEILKYIHEHPKDVTGARSSLRWRLHDWIAGKVLRLKALGRPALNADRIRKTLEKLFGHLRLSDVRAALVFPAYDVRSERPVLFSSSSARADPSANFLLVDAIRASSAVPSMFLPVEMKGGGGVQSPEGGPVCVDGGIWAANPSLLAYAEARRLFPGAGVRILLVALGTGAPQPGSPRSRRKAVRRRSFFAWVVPVMKFAPVKNLKLYIQI